MNVVGRTLWHIETNLDAPVSLNDLAAVVSVSPFHLSRAFARAPGHPVMRDVWRRRLTRAAKALAFGQATVLTIALDAGYANPEAFTRAFRAEFGQTPSLTRRHRSLDDLTLTPPQQPRTRMMKTLAAPRSNITRRSSVARPRRLAMKSGCRSSRFARGAPQQPG